MICSDAIAAYTDAITDYIKEISIYIEAIDVYIEEMDIYRKEIGYVLCKNGIEECVLCRGFNGKGLLRMDVYWFSAA